MSGAATPATAALSEAGVDFTLHRYEPDLAESSLGLQAAERLGVDPAVVFKTLMISADGKMVVAVVPVADTVDLKALAAALGAKRTQMAVPQDAERASGYVIGGISPIGQRRRHPTIIDRSAEKTHTLFVNGGKRGLMIEISPKDLLLVTGARYAAITVAAPRE